MGYVWWRGRCWDQVSILNLSKLSINFFGRIFDDLTDILKTPGLGVDGDLFFFRGSVGSKAMAGGVTL